MDASERLVSLWTMQDSLLQWHRAIFITAQSVLLGLAAAVAPTARFPASLLVFPGVILVCAWLRLCNARARSESYLQMLVLESEDGKTPEKPLNLYHKFQSNREYQREIRASEPFKRLRWTVTRRLIDVLLPMVFLVLWVLLIVYLTGAFGARHQA